MTTTAAGMMSGGALLSFVGIFVGFASIRFGRQDSAATTQGHIANGMMIAGAASIVLGIPLLIAGLQTSVDQTPLRGTF